VASKARFAFRESAAFKICAAPRKDLSLLCPSPRKSQGSPRAALTLTLTLTLTPTLTLTLTLVRTLALTLIQTLTPSRTLTLTLTLTRLAPGGTRCRQSRRRQLRC
jgi:hypothetical protein